MSYLIMIAKYLFQDAHNKNWNPHFSYGKLGSLVCSMNSPTAIYPTGKCQSQKLNIYMSVFTQDTCSKHHGSLFSLPLKLASHPQCFRSSTCPKGSVLLNQYSLHFLFLVWPTSAAHLVNCIFKEASKFLEGQSLIVSNNFPSGCIRANRQGKYWELDHQSGREDQLLLGVPLLSHGCNLHKDQYSGGIMMTMTGNNIEEKTLST